jgi:UDP-4-amino-4,6-dideoxy-N-acetyl-beta-L-altrosamine N-acetyltransferase
MPDHVSTIQLVPLHMLPEKIQQETRLWRNHPDVAQWFQKPMIDEATHTQWLASLHDDHPRNIAFLISNADSEQPLGVTYFHSIDYTARTADWGIYITQTHQRGRGVGSQALAQCLAYAKHTLALERVFLEVLAHNTKARHVYERAGFMQVSEQDGLCRYGLALGDAVGVDN